MTVKECYDAMGADYEDVFARLRKDERIQKFLLKVMNDKSYDLLCSSLESGDMAEAFRAAHTLKGRRLFPFLLHLGALLLSEGRQPMHTKNRYPSKFHGCYTASVPVPRTPYG